MLIWRRKIAAHFGALELQLKIRGLKVDQTAVEWKHYKVILAEAVIVAQPPWYNVSSEGFCKQQKRSRLTFVPNGPYYAHITRLSATRRKLVASLQGSNAAKQASEGWVTQLDIFTDTIRDFQMFLLHQNLVFLMPDSLTFMGGQTASFRERRNVMFSKP